MVWNSSFTQTRMGWFGGWVAAALEAAKQRFASQCGVANAKQQSLQAALPKQSAGLQVVDYCLWALQRLIVRGDDASWARISGRCVEIVSIDHKALGVEKTFCPGKSMKVSDWAPGI